MDDRPGWEHDEWLPPARFEPRPYIDPSYSVVHDDPVPTKRNEGNDWLIPAAIVMAGIVLAVAVVVSRKAPQAPATTYSPVAAPTAVVQTVAPPPPVILPSPPTVISPSDAAAQKTLEDVVAVARTIRGQTGSYAGVTSFALARALPADSYEPPTSASTGPSDVSISAAPTIFSAAVLSQTGTCFWIRDFEGTHSAYGAGVPCTGTAAVDAMLPDWPVPGSPSVTPTLIP